jgi:hypothetical protein
MARLPQIQQFDTGQVFATRDRARERYMQDERQSRLQQIGQAAAGGDYRAAANQAFQGGDLDVGASFAGMADQEKKALVTKASAFAAQANTPEKWEAGRQYWEQQGFDIGDFGQRDALMAQSLTASDFLNQQNHQQEFDATQSHRAQTLGLQRQRMAQAQAATTAQPAFQPPKMNSTIQKEMFETDETISAAQSTLGNLQEMEKLNDLAVESGMGSAGVRVGQFLGVPIAGMDREQLDASIQLRTLATQNALDMLKATFGSMPSDGERKILIEVQGSIDQPRSVRADIYKRAMGLVERRLAAAQQKAQGLRTGEYFAPQQQPVTITTPGGLEVEIGE